MFEKKAEEMAKNFAMHEMKYCTYEDYSIPKSPIKIAEESYLAGYNKANEWHYVKDGDFPKGKTEKKYLVALKSEYTDIFYETDIWCESLHCFASNHPKNVIAWKEIVFPEVKESE